MHINKGANLGEHGKYGRYGKLQLCVSVISSSVREVACCCECAVRLNEKSMIFLVPRCN
ncbi:hypothetical protein [Methanosarcina sp. DH2]|uniref:hypothetical protein n=1 Tax=Methanosarcina sp. DH2 TaxID=2605639 RepID=UPI001E554151|nr:hypothetical protein [Methanosarcina sp. DH2]